MTRKELKRQRKGEKEIDVCFEDAGFDRIAYDNDGRLKSITLRSGRTINAQDLETLGLLFEGRISPMYQAVLEWSFQNSEEPAQQLAANPQPPVNSEFLLHILLPKEQQDAVIGDLVEMYGRKYKRFGKWRANLWFYS